MQNNKNCFPADNISHPESWNIVSVKHEEEEEEEEKGNCSGSETEKKGACIKFVKENTALW